MALCLHHHCEQDDPLDPIIICRQSCSRTFVTDTASSLAILGLIILNLLPFDVFEYHSVSMRGHDLVITTFVHL